MVDGIQFLCQILNLFLRFLLIECLLSLLPYFFVQQQLRLDVVHAQVIVFLHEDVVQHLRHRASRLVVRAQVGLLSQRAPDASDSRLDRVVQVLEVDILPVVRRKAHYHLPGHQVAVDADRHALILAAEHHEVSDELESREHAYRLLKGDQDVGALGVQFESRVEEGVARGHLAREHGRWRVPVGFGEDFEVPDGFLRLRDGHEPLQVLVDVEARTHDADQLHADESLEDDLVADLVLLGF